MKTRRTFLQAGSAALAGHVLGPQSHGQKPEREGSPAVPASGARDYWNDYPNYLASVVNSARVRRKQDLSRLKSEEAIAERAALVRKKIWELLGGPLEKTPLNVINTGTIERDGYRIEKLIFESQPKFYVPAHLYVPKNGHGPFPAVLSPLGHTAEGKFFSSYQSLFQNLARKGYVILTWDPPGQGERLQYMIPGTDKSPFGPTGEHMQFGWPAFLVGSTTTQFETWDAVRALDYLLSRPEVDTKRVGCCGHSGGGTATMYLCALEPRIQTAVIVEGHTENVAGANYEPPGAYADAEQNIIGGLKFGLDRGDLLTSFAPKPLLICFTHMDVGATYSPHYEQGTREIFQELSDIYSVCGTPEKVGLSASNLPHDYDFFHRRATYDWFNKWLGQNHADNTESKFDEAPLGTLSCTSTGQILTSVGGRTAYQVNDDRLRIIQAKRGTALPSREQIRNTLREILALPASSTPLKPETLSKNTRQDLVIEEFHFYSEPLVRVPGWFLKPAAAALKLPVALLLTDSGKNRLFDQDELVMQVTARNMALCAIDLRASGQATPRFPSSGPLFYSRAVEMAYSLVSLSAGVPLNGGRVWDLLRCLEYLNTRSDVDSSRVGIVGTGATGIEALFGAALDERIRALLLQHTLTDFSSLVAARDYNLKVASFPFGLLQHFDLPEICSSIAPRPLWFANPVNPQGTPLPLSEVNKRYGSIAQVYDMSQKPGGFAVHVDPGRNTEIFEKWVKTALS